MYVWNENVLYNYELFNHTELWRISNEFDKSAGSLAINYDVEISRTAHFHKDSQRDTFKDVFALLMRRLGRCRCIEDLRKCPSLLSITPNVAYSRYAVTAHFIVVILINSATHDSRKNRFEFLIPFIWLDETSRYRSETFCWYINIFWYYDVSFTRYFA